MIDTPCRHVVEMAFRHPQNGHRCMCDEFAAPVEQLLDAPETLPCHERPESFADVAADPLGRARAVPTMHGTASWG
jgi:hypothetical protein